MTQWISVKDRLPELCADGYSKTVLVWMYFDYQVEEDGDHGLAYLTTRDTWVSREERYNTITHWMPLPAAPKGEKL